MNLIPAREIAQLWGVSETRVNDLCRQGRVPGAEQRIVRGHALWYIPEGAEKPTDQTRGPKKKEARL